MLNYGIASIFFFCAVAMAEYGKQSKLWFIFTCLECVASVAMTFLIMEWTDLIIPFIVGFKVGSCCSRD